MRNGQEFYMAEPETMTLWKHVRDTTYMQLEGREPLLLLKVNRPTMIVTGGNYLYKNRRRGISCSAHE